MTEMEVEVSPALQKEIEKKVAEIKAEKPNLRIIFPIIVDGNVEFGEKEHYVAYFSQPNFMAFSKYLTASQKDSVLALRTLANDIFLGGDKELIDDDSLFLFGLMGQLSKVIEMRNGRLVNLSKAGK